jgi:hypothetical protein
MEIGVPSIDTSGFKPHQLANAGLVICSLSDGEEEVVAVNMVTQARRFAPFSSACLWPRLLDSHPPTRAQRHWLENMDRRGNLPRVTQEEGGRVERMMMTGGALISVPPGH